MNRRFLSCAAAVAVAAAGLTGTSASAQQSPGTPDAAESMTPAAGMHTLRIGPSPEKPTYVGAPASARRAATDSSGSRAAAGSWWKVYYHDFTPEVQASFQRAVNIWSKRLTSRAPITVKAVWADLPEEVLAQAGPNEVYWNFTGAEKRDTVYPATIANHIQGKQIDGATPDMVVYFNRNHADNFHFGADPAPADKLDFTTIVLHEIGHGLGSMGFGTVNNGLGRIKRYSGGRWYMMPWDHFTTTGTGSFLKTYGTDTLALGNHLQWTVRFDSPEVRAVNGGNSVKLYAPNPWEPGSSYSHLDEATYPAGDPNSLMTPKLGRGETIRDPGDITMAMYDSLGW